MTSDDIKQMADKATLAIDGEIRAAKAQGVDGSGLGFQWTRELLNSTIRKAALQAYEESARLACGHCFNSLRVEERDDSWIHPAQSYWPEMRCTAGAIYARIASLKVVT